MGFGGNLLLFRGEIFWKTRETRKFSRSRGFHDNFAFFLRWWSSNEAPLGHWPRHFLRQGKLRRENRAAVTIMEENIDLIFSLRRAAFLLLHPVLHGPRWEHLFTRSGISGDEKSRTHKKHKKNRNFTKKTKISLAPQQRSSQHLPSGHLPAPITEGEKTLVRVRPFRGTVFFSRPLQRMKNGFFCC